jgi:hypothetical protein
MTKLKSEKRVDFGLCLVSTKSHHTVRKEGDSVMLGLTVTTLHVKMLSAVTALDVELEFVVGGTYTGGFSPFGKLPAARTRVMFC